ncbi:LeuA family protein [Fluviispira multicolorata]|uniref:2-isopropylmalate synthase n=1 Tax=Fluviispira multicolorata TaxID=2654512 RepID=A0A833JEZ6_9BACT|nr:alpha-isopropylmalate synthase regulatory domain-containing protein [Fluviispira multicolorata]KAB8033168.1 2-isopropylmalate synthase [Fluviispira multicolorata]
MQKKQIKIFDTTLRDGQQCPGAGMSFENNIEYAKLAANANIDIIEVGFPSASKLDFLIVNTVAKEISNKDTSPIIAALCQLRENQIETTVRALEPLIIHQKARLHTYLPVDPQLLSALGDYGRNFEQMTLDVYNYIKIACDSGVEVEFSPEGYSRMGENFSFVTDVIRAAIEAGATIINCPDTIGGACKLQGDDYFVEKMKLHANIMEREFPDRNITWSTHCHNDFGLALENSMNAVFMGPATQVEGCFNGIGERAGNVSLEQSIMYLKKFGSQGKNQIEYETNVKIDSLQTISDFVSLNMLARQPHWPITGDNAAKHSSGGHTNAIIKNPLSYQPFDPEEIGKKISFLFGPFSGGNHAKEIIEEHGYICNEEEKAKIAQYIKDVHSERRKGITDSELINSYLDFRKPIKINNFYYAKSENENSIEISGEFFGENKKYRFTVGKDGSAFTALYNAISGFIPDFRVGKYSSQSLSEGVNSISSSKTIIEDSNNNMFIGSGEDLDIELSALKSLIDAANKMYIQKNYIQRN